VNYQKEIDKIDRGIANFQNKIQKLQKIKSTFQEKLSHHTEQVKTKKK
jgi:prefoldin subunit 5